jgi:ribonuclease E
MSEPAAWAAPVAAPALAAYEPSVAAPTYAAPVLASQVIAAPVAVEATAPAVAPVAAPGPVAAPAPVRAEPFALPTDALHSLAAGAGLQWVNSDADKIRVVHEAMAREPKPVHVPRQPRVHVLVDDGPLVLVETRRDLSQQKLPFDHGAGAT